VDKETDVEECWLCSSICLVHGDIQCPHVTGPIDKKAHRVIVPYYTLALAMVVLEGSRGLILSARGFLEVRASET
jgi:hypothetical protein